MTAPPSPQRADAPTPVLICGAGPTGMVLALWLTKAGVRVRIIDKATGPGTTSRATVFHARNLEFYHQLGIDQTAIDQGIKFDSGTLWVKGEQAAQVTFGEMGKGISPYPFILCYPQDQHEAMLEAELAKLGVIVERNTTLISFLSGTDYVQAQLRNATGAIEKCEARFLAGCDGAHSVVRINVGLGFPGGTYQEMFYVADLKVSGPVANGKLNLALDDVDFLAVFPMKGEGRVRVIGTITRDAWNKEQIRWDDVSESIIRRLKVTVEEVRWFSSYRVHHRVATHFRQENVFLLGDAGHIHSPVGGQGMNTGIGDAINLAWKLAAVINDKAPVKLLETYEPERIAFARRLVATTDTAFTFVNRKSFLAKQLRTRIVPLLAPLLFKSNAARKKMFRTVSQILIDYPDSALSEGNAGKIKGGDRLPWFRDESGNDNYAPLVSRQWQVYRYGDASPDLEALCLARGIALNLSPFTDVAQKAGFHKNAVYVIRPDGHVALAEGSGDIGVIKGYFDSWNLRINTHATSSTHSPALFFNSQT